MVKSTIYKIVCKDPSITDCYVGRTIDVTSRFTQHRTCFNNCNSTNHNYKVYQKIREFGGLTNWEFIEIETIEHEPKETLPAREREAFWFNELKATLNNNVPNRSHPESRKQWRDKNAEYLMNYRKTYNENNKELIAEQHKNYVLNNKEKVYAKMKQWVQNNRDKNREYQRNRYQKLRTQKLQEDQNIKE